MAKVVDLLDKALTILNDPGGARWPLSELLGYFRDGLVDLASHHPELFTVRGTVNLTAGSRQDLPAGTVGVDEVLSVTTDGVTTYPTQTTRELLDRHQPGWASATAGPARDYVADPRTPVIWLSPPQPATPGTMDVSYYWVNPGIGLADDIPVADSWEPALMDYVLYRAFAKDATHGDVAKQGAYFTSYAARIGAGTNGG